MNFLERNLYALLSDIQSRPKKSFRSELVSLGFTLCQTPNAPQSSDLQLLQLCGEILEDLHTGSLIVDDIEDNSSVRRGDRTLHRKYGLGLALNAGNFLYFQALHKVQSLQTTEQVRQAITNKIVNTLWEAHQGQALDLGLRADQLSRAELITASKQILKGKSGALTSLAIQVGALIAGCTNESQLQAIEKVGYRFGECLQRFDDIGNLQIHQPTEKHLEDLSLRRVTYLWSYLAENETEENFIELQKWHTDPRPLNEKLFILKDFLKRQNVLKNAQQASQMALNDALTEFKKELRFTDDHKGFQKFLQLAERLTYAYQESELIEESSRHRQWIWRTGNSHSPAGRGLSSPNI